MTSEKPVGPLTALSALESSVGSFPIVGIGCSAGGLDALEKFFSHVPPDSGIAFIVVQHLAPDHTSALPDLLRRFTSMTVAEAKDGMTIQPDCVYIIPPSKDLSLLHGKLHLLKLATTHGPHLTIDFFFRSLAEDLQAKAIGVILSGMGSDGVLGLLAIKEKTGLTLVQEPASAGADGMPKSAIEAGAADMIAPPEALPGLIADYLGRPAVLVHAELPAPPKYRVLSRKSSSCCVIVEATTSPSTRPIPCSAGSSGACRFITSPPLMTTCPICATTRQNSACCSRNC